MIPAMIITSVGSVRNPLHWKLELAGTGVPKPDLGNQEMLAEWMIKVEIPFAEEGG